LAWGGVFYSRFYMIQLILDQSLGPSFIVDSF
jgi:hypothetical protein